MEGGVSADSGVGVMVFSGGVAWSVWDWNGEVGLVWCVVLVFVDGVGLAFCVDGGLGCFWDFGLQMPSTLISVFLHGWSFAALNQGPKGWSSALKLVLFRSHMGQSFSLCDRSPHQ